MDQEFANFAEWGGADTPKESHTPPKGAHARISPSKPVLPQKPLLNVIPKNGATGVQSQPLATRPHVYSKREEPKPQNTNKLSYSNVVKNSTTQNSVPLVTASFNPRSMPKQIDHLKQPERPVNQRYQSEPKQREHLKGPKFPAPPTASTVTARSAKPHNSFAKVRPQGLGEEERNEMRDTVAKDTAQYTQILEPSISLPFEVGHEPRCQNTLLS